VSNICHAVVWVDHSEAKVFRFSGDEDSSLQRLHHRREGWEAGGNPPAMASRVFAVETLDHPDSEALLVLGRRHFQNTASTP
jgi:hypothetical protein